MNHVLVVDDEEDVLDLVKTVLTGNGYQVTTAKTGEQALIQAVENRPDLILLDLVMPGISGLEVCRLLKSKKDFKKVPIIMMSVLDRPIDHQHIEEARADSFIHKPFDIDQLLITVDSIQNKKNRQK
ncbi:response regulator [archaeon]|nr:response regulator [archaeon]